MDHDEMLMNLREIADNAAVTTDLIFAEQRRDWCTAMEQAMALLSQPTEGVTLQLTNEAAVALQQVIGRMSQTKGGYTEPTVGGPCTNNQYECLKLLHCKLATALTRKGE